MWPYHVSPHAAAAVSHVPSLWQRSDINMLLHSIRARVHYAGSSLFQKLQAPGGSLNSFGSLVGFPRGRFREGPKYPHSKKTSLHPVWYCLWGRTQGRCCLEPHPWRWLCLRCVLTPRDISRNILNSPPQKKPLADSSVSTKSSQKKGFTKIGQMQKGKKGASTM